MKPGRDVTRLLDIMRALRDPETGCPWDVEQTFASIAPYTIEETHEVVDAIERNDMVDLREELGDLLLQVVFHSRMAQEMGAFDFGDVVEGITTKMIRRHPHVFGDAQARSAGMAKGMWDAIKAEEKAEKRALKARQGTPEGDDERPRHLLDDVPAALPAMMEAMKLQKAVARVGFDWNDSRAVLAKIREEVDEFETALDGDQAEAARKDELGDILFTLVNLARHHDLDPEGALRGTNMKMRKRFAAIEDALRASGKTFETTTLDEMERHWQEAKAE